MPEPVQTPPAGGAPAQSGNPAPTPTTGAGASDPNSNLENYIPKYRFDEINKRAQEAEKEIAELKKQLSEGKSKDDRIASLEKELADTKSGYEVEKQNAKRQQAIDEAIKDKVVDPEVVLKLLDLTKINFNEKGEVQGLDEQLKTLKESKPYLWKVAKKLVQPGTGGEPNQGKSFAQQMAEKKVSQMGVTAKSKTYF